jgi:Ca-activated chloride channel family protein
MSFLNPLALLLFIPLFFIFKSKLVSKDEFLLNSSMFNKQTKLLMLVLALCVIALSRPALQNKLTKQKFDANEYIIALDASFSMQADDIKPSRYEIAKQNIISLLKKDTQNRYSIFAFTTNPLLICPPTTDTRIAISALEALVPKYILTKGTSLQALLEFVSTLPQEKKNLIIFSDGGDEHQLNSLLSIAKKAAISINVVAIASKKGVALKKLSAHLRDSNGDLVISRANPILEDLAKQSGGIYLHVEDEKQNITDELFEALKQKANKDKKLQTDIISYKELYYYPLLLAFVLLITALTKLQKFVPLLSLVFVFVSAQKAQAGMLDFYYLKEAKQAYKQKEYKKSAIYYEKLSPSIASYLNTALAYYKAGMYSKAMNYYSQIESANPKIKQTVFYNMGNCAVKLKKYDRAKTYYKQALALGYDKDAYENLMMLYKLNLKAKVNVTDMLPKPNAKEKKNSSKKTDNQKDDKKNDNENNKSGKSQKESLNSSASSGQQNKSHAKANSKEKNKANKNIYQMGYKAYELINKGYTNETNPW